MALDRNRDRTSRPSKPSRVDAALADWKAAEATRGVPSISSESRATVFQEIRRTEAAPRSLASLFIPVRRLVIAGGLPVALLTISLGLLGMPRDSGNLSDGHSARISASKVDGEVVFDIANGTRTHRVSKSSIPSHFEAAGSVTVRDGAYRDGLDEGASLVFYRIE